MPILLRDLYGLQVFDCAKLSATLSPVSCRDNFINRRALACIGCPTGAELTGTTTSPASPRPEFQLDRPARMRSIESCRWRPCIRCERPAPRLVWGAWCVSCYNRAREVVIGRNGKGAFPTITAARLHPVCALIAADDSTIRAALAHRSFIAQLQRYGSGTVWVSASLTGRAELERLIERRIPGGRLLEYDERQRAA